jgi:hypothetical protein
MTYWYGRQLRKFYVRVPSLAVILGLLLPVLPLWLEALDLRQVLPLVAAEVPYRDFRL